VHCLKKEKMLKWPKNIPLLECLEDEGDKSNKEGIFLEHESPSSEFFGEELEDDILDGLEVDRRLDTLMAWSHAVCGRNVLRLLSGTGC
jgi:hypothetical protein